MNLYIMAINRSFCFCHTAMLQKCILQSTYQHDTKSKPLNLHTFQSHANRYLPKAHLQIPPRQSPGQRPKFFDENMRWIFGKENDDKFYVGSNDEVSNYFCGGEIGIKFNNFQNKIFRHLHPHTEPELIDYLKVWFEL